MTRSIAKVAMAGLSIAAMSACGQRAPAGPTPASLPLVRPLGLKTGNDAPNGGHYNLNLIGVPHDKTADISGNNGHRIFIYYIGRTKIMLAEGDYQVVDANGTDDGMASFLLPNPDNGSGDLAYSVWIRPVAGKGDISFQSCFTDSTGTWCYAGGLVQKLTKNNKFKDVSRDLLQVCADVDGTGNYQLVPLFSDSTANYFWYVDNNGMRNTQLRFYPLSTTSIGGGC